MKKQILDAAMDLFLEAGFDNVSMRNISERIEYSPGTIYLYFRDMNDILFSLHSIGFEKLHRAQKKRPSADDPLERLRKHVDLYVDFGLRNPGLYDLMFILRGPVQAMKAIQGVAWEAGMRCFGALREDVASCIAAGVLPKSDPDIVTLSLWSLTHGAVALVIRDRLLMFEGRKAGALAKAACAFVLNAICVDTEAKRS